MTDLAEYVSDGVFPCPHVPLDGITGVDIHSVH